MLTKQLLPILRTSKVTDGFTLTENLVSILILSITLTAMMPAFMNFGIQNIKNRQFSGAVAVTNTIMSDLRRQTMDSLNNQLGKNTINGEAMGYTYQVDKYICTGSTALDVGNPGDTCSGTIGQNDLSRQILLEVKSPSNPNETIYRVQTVFTRLRS